MIAETAPLLTRCPRCDAVNTRNNRFCTTCGSALRCDTCNAWLEPKTRFCTSCGAAVPSMAEPPAAQRSVEDTVVQTEPARPPEPATRPSNA